MMLNIFIQALAYDDVQVNDNNKMEWDYTVKYVLLFDAYTKI